ncbi:uncharacterized protein LOC120381937 isoform X2 [Mauremys reevesii]|uniref:uncharacterized protein LOC120381937 isoform X2 n=1 Tax=Mauremys reevesii TaxID=260615 RepID=UPI00193FF676|nr:uncharacterized protein LOC120381937 isoform X2 [Mauremys reevesii]
MGGGLWLPLAWVTVALSCSSAWPLPGATTAPACSLPWVPLRGLLPPGRVPLLAVDLVPRGAGPETGIGGRSGIPVSGCLCWRGKGMLDFSVYTTTLSYRHLPASRASPGVVRLACCSPSSPPGKGSGAVSKCCEDRIRGAFRGRSRRIQRKRHLPSWPGNSTEVEAEADVTVGPSPSREAAPRSRDRVEVMKMTAKGATKDRGVALVLSGLAATVSVLFLAGGALLARQRCSNVAV